MGEPVAVEVWGGKQTVTVHKMTWGVTPQGAPGLAVEVELSCTSGECSAPPDRFVAMTPTRRVWGKPDQTYNQLVALNPGQKDRATFHFTLSQESGTLEFGEGAPDNPDVPEHLFAIPLPS